MNNQIASPLANIIKQAAATVVEGPAAKLKKRFLECSEEIVVVADVSGSMGDLIGHAQISKWEHLKIALDDVRAAFPRIRLIVFQSYPRELRSIKQLPPPGGSTRLDEALLLAAKYRPRKTIVISDGLPDDGDRALEIADQLTGSIDTIYCGPDCHPAVDWLRKLSRNTGGRPTVVWDGYREALTSTVRGLLGP